MASESTLDKYRQKIGQMDTPALREEIQKLEDNLVRVAGELYALDTAPESLGNDKSHKSKVTVRINNQSSWDQRLDAAISELKGRGETYVPSPEYGKLCDLAADIYNAVRVVYVVRGEDGRSYGYDLILEPTGFLAKASGYGPFNPETIPVATSTRSLLVNSLLNNYIFSWGGKYMQTGAKTRARWMLDIYTRDGGCISYKGNVYHPYNFQQVSLAIESAARM